MKTVTSNNYNIGGDVVDITDVNISEKDNVKIRTKKQRLKTRKCKISVTKPPRSNGEKQDKEVKKSSNVNIKIDDVLNKEMSNSQSNLNNFVQLAKDLSKADLSMSSHHTAHVDDVPLKKTKIRRRSKNVTKLNSEIGKLNPQIKNTNFEDSNTDDKITNLHADEESEINEFNPRVKNDSVKVSITDDKDTNLHVDEIKSLNNVSLEENEGNESRNAFEFMMDRRHKVIGRNSPGKEIENQDCDDDSNCISENKQKLLARKSVLENWTIAKGRLKRLREEHEKELYINHQLDRRAKKMKKMLSCEQSDTKMVSRGRKIRKQIRRIDSDSDSDVIINEPEIVNIHSVENQEYVESEVNDLKNLTERKNGMQKGLLNFFDVLNRKERVDDDIGNKNSKLIKIKMFSQNILTRNSTKHSNKTLTNLNKETLVHESEGNDSESGEWFNQEETKPMRKLKKVSKNKVKNIKQNQVQNTNPQKIKILDSEKISPNIDVIIVDEHLENFANNDKFSDSIESRLQNKDQIEDSKYETIILDENSTDIPSKCTKKKIKSKLSKQKKITTKENKIALETNESRKSLRQCTKKAINYDESELEIPNDSSCHSKTRRKPNITLNCDFSEDSNDSIKTKLRKKTSKTSQPNNSLNNSVHFVKKMDIKLAPIFVMKPKVDPSVIEARKTFLLSGVPESIKRKMEKQHSIEELEYDVFPTISHVQQKTENPETFWSLPPPELNLVDFDVSLPFLTTMHQGSVTNQIEEKHKQALSYPREKITKFKSILKDIKRNNPEHLVYKIFKTLRIKTDKPNSQNSKSTSETNEISEFSDCEMWTDKYKAKISEEILGNHSSTKKLKNWLHSWLENCLEMKRSEAKSKSSDSDSDYFNDKPNNKEPGNAVILSGPNGCGKTMTVYALCNEMGINVLELNASTRRTGKRLNQELQEATQSHQVRKNEVSGLSTFFQSNSQSEIEENTKQKMCLLLVEDIDVVFEQDDGFLTVLSQLLATSKRPIILITSDINCPSLQKFTSQYPIIKFDSLSPRILSIWLQILLLIEGLKVERYCIDEMLELNQGDARKTLLQLQFWATTGGSANPDAIPIKQEETSITNDISNISDDLDDSQKIVSHSNCASTFTNFENFPLDKIWWNVSDLLNSTYSLTVKETDKNDLINLKCVSYIFESFSVADIAFNKLGESHYENWHQGSLKNSLEWRDCMESYDTKRELVEDWTSHLLKGQLCGKLETMHLGLPSTKKRRWCLKQKACYEKFMEIVPHCNRLDRRAFSLDYFTTLRNITRFEAHRSTINSKRKNRFCHYLRNNLGMDLDETTNKAAQDILINNSENTL